MKFNPPGFTKDFPSREPARIPTGAIRQTDQSVEWIAWSPFIEHMELVIVKGEATQIHPMQRDEEYHRLRMDGIDDGLRYLFRLPEGDFPDPGSRWQPDGVDRPSAVFTPERFPWTDQDWKGIDRSDLVLYELHVGTFTKEGSFEAIISRLRDLKDLGITAIELMPVAQFSGTRNWGYDGVFPYAVQNSYGGPRSLQHFVDAAHAAGVAVILDVVYNHLGPEGNHLARFGPYFTEAYRTPWGDAVNFDQVHSDAVRQFVIENARMWVRDFHLDGLRLDAVHAIYDFGSHHLLAEISEAVHDIGREQSRVVHVIAESDQNDPRLIDAREERGYGLDVVWADEFHHCLRALIAGDREGYFQGFGRLEHLAKAIEDVFVYDGRYCPFRKRRHGAPVANRDRTQFVVSIHNHDQIGNRPKGDRSASYLSQSALRLACGLLLLSPCLPMLFMGEEYAEQRPFPFFCSFEDPELIESVRNGRRKEFEGLGFVWGEDIPDPQDERTFQSAVLSWDWIDTNFSGQLRNLYRDLLLARRNWPPLRDRQYTRAFVGDMARLLIVERGSQPSLVAIANFSDQTQERPRAMTEGKSVLLATESERYGGERPSSDVVAAILPYELVIFGQKERQT